MVFVVEGMQLRIPVGGLVITLDGSDAPPVIVELSVDTWPHWLEEAITNVDRAKSAHAALLAAHAAGDNPAKARALDDEFRRAMVSMSSAAIALDAFYAAVKDHVPPPPDLEAAWRKNGTSRPARICETLRRAFTLSNAQAGDLRATLGELFKWRGYAVHPPAGYRAPIMHPDLGTGVEWRYVGFTAEGCTKATYAALAIIHHCLNNPRRKYPELVKWATAGRPRIQPMAESWVEQHGPPSTRSRHPT